MQQIRVPLAEAGRRIDKYLMKYFDAAPKSFIYKAFRKKNIRLCGKRAAGNELLNEGDLIELFFSDETIASMKKSSGGAVSGKAVTIVREEEAEHGAGAYTAVGSASGILHGGNADLTGSHNKANNGIQTGKQAVSGKKQKVSAGDKAELRKYCGIVYEDKDVIFADKRANVLSQKAEPGDYSLNEALLDYCGGKRADSSFIPAVCNRIDRNTTGLVCFAKSYRAARIMSEMLKDRSLEKYYLAAVYGVVSEASHVEAWLVKEKKSNTVTVYDRPIERAEHIETAFRPVDKSEAEALGLNNTAAGIAGGSLGGYPYTIIKVGLITGKSHQIRAQLAALGHPILGDPKYGSREINKLIAAEYGIRTQLLHAWEIHFPEHTPSPLDDFAGKRIRTRTAEWVKLLQKKPIREFTHSY